VQAYATAVKQSDRHPAILALYAESRIYANEGGVDDDIMDTLVEAVDKDPSQFKAVFYLGYAKVKIGDFKGAIQDWTNLVAMAPKDTAWMAQVYQQIAMAAEAGNLDPSSFEPSGRARVISKQLKLEWETEASHNHDEEETAKGPTQEDMQNASEMSEEDRAELIRAMVERLADRLEENPDDLEGWKRLARAYQVLGEKDKAIEARNKIKELSGS